MYRNIHHGSTLQRGGGIGSIFASLGRWLIPLITKGTRVAVKHGSTFAKSKAGKTILRSAQKELGRSSARLAKNVSEGKNPKRDMRKDLKRASSNILNSALNLEKARNGKKAKKIPRKSGGASTARISPSWI